MLTVKINICFLLVGINAFTSYGKACCNVGYFEYWVTNFGNIASIVSTFTNLGYCVFDVG